MQSRNEWTVVMHLISKPHHVIHEKKNRKKDLFQYYYELTPISLKEIVAGFEWKYVKHVQYSCDGYGISVI